MTVQAATMRPHVALAVSDVDHAVDFYAALFGQSPNKRKPDYAKFDLSSPALNLSLNASPTASGSQFPQHFGIEVADADAVRAARARISQAGLTIESDEQGVTCCYAVQDKFWVRDPDGHAWEVFTVLDDAEVHSTERAPLDSDVVADRECCAPSCCK